MFYFTYNKVKSWYLVEKNVFIEMQEYIVHTGFVVCKSLLVLHVLCLELLTTTFLIITGSVRAKVISNRLRNKIFQQFSFFGCSCLSRWWWPPNFCRAPAGDNRFCYHSSKMKTSFLPFHLFILLKAMNP